jgi:hypothetical protein
MKSVYLLSLLLSLSLSQVIPDGTPRLSGAGYITTDCTRLQLGQEAPFPNYFLDQTNNYFLPNLRLLASQRDLPNSCRRGLRFPNYGCAEATFNILPNLPAAYAKGLFATPNSYRALLRFTGGSEELQNTGNPAENKGFAFKLFKVGGVKLIPGFEDDNHFDFEFSAFPVFPSGNETVFAAAIMSRTQVNGGGDRGRSLFGTAYPATAALAAQERVNNSVSSVLLMPYWSACAFKYGPDPLPSPAAKYRVFPCDGVNQTFFNQSTAAPDHLTQDLTNRLAARSYCFVFQVQLQTDACKQPINDWAVEWLEADAPYVTVATIDIPIQAVQTEANNHTCKHFTISPWRVTNEHRPLGAHNRVRLLSHMNSANQRFVLNHIFDPITQRSYAGFQYFTADELTLDNNYVSPKLKTGNPYSPNPGQYHQPTPMFPPCPSRQCS